MANKKKKRRCLLCNRDFIGRNLTCPECYDDYNIEEDDENFIRC